MAVANGTKLIAALARYEPALLVGTPEGPRIEFKRPSAYRLEHDSGKWELAKDVAAMANVEGGLIVIGVATTKDPYVAGDVASAIAPCKAPYDLAQIKSVLAGWLFPPQHVGLDVFPIADQSPEHLLVITVDPVPERDRYETCTFFQTSIEFRPTLQQQQHDDAAAKDQAHRQQLFGRLLADLDQDAS